MSQTLARRIADLNNMLANMSAMKVTLTRHRNDLLVAMATVCKVEGFDVDVLPLDKTDGDMLVTWKKKDVRHGIDKSEREEIVFRIRQLEAMGFRRPVVQSDSAHHTSFVFKVK